MAKNTNARSRVLDQLLSYAPQDPASRITVLRRYLTEALPNMETDDCLFFDKGLLTMIVAALPAPAAPVNAGHKPTSA